MNVSALKAKDLFFFYKEMKEGALGQETKLKPKGCEWTLEELEREVQERLWIFDDLKV